MLTTTVMSLNWQALNFLSRWAFLLPLKANPETGQISTVSKRRYWLVLLHLSIMVLNFVFKLVRFLEGWSNGWKSIWVVFEHAQVMIFQLHVISDISLFLKCEHICLFLNGAHSFIRERSVGLEKDLKSGMKRLDSILELTIFFLPQNSMNSLFIYVVMCSAQPDADYWIYSTVPEAYRSPWLRVLCVGLDGWVLTTVFATMYFALFLTCSVPIPYLYKGLLKTVEQTLTGVRDPRKLFKAKRTLTAFGVQIKLYNELQATLNYSTKVSVIALGTFGIFGGIRFWDTEPLLAAVMSVGGLNACFFFVLLYGKIYIVSETGEKLRKKIKRIAKGSSCSLGFKDYILKSMNAIPKFRLKVGPFHTFDRMAVPTFFDFVLGQVVDLLMTFK